MNKESFHRNGTVLCHLLLASLVLCSCGSKDTTTDQDKREAEETIKKLLNSTSFAEYLQCWNKENRKVFQDLPLARKNWEALKHKGSPVWTLGEVEGVGEGKIDVETQHKFNPRSVRSWLLEKEDGKWVVAGVAFEG